MFTSLSAALTALTAHATGVDVVGNNLANLNTPGYKASTVYFHDLVSQELGAGGQTQIGLGTGRPYTMRQFTQGAVQTTGAPLDAAIEGDGLFVVSTSTGGAAFTRAGSFKVDKDGYLITPTGQRLQGWMADVNGVISTTGAPGDLKVPIGSSKVPVVTGNVSITANLDATAAVDPSSTLTVPVEVYDSRGNSHALSFEFVRTATDTWDCSVYVDGADVGGTAGTPTQVGATQTLTFDANGVLTNPAAGAPVAIDITGLADGAADMTINWNLYSSTGTALFTQYAQASSPAQVTQDGSPAAQLLSVAIADGGILMAQYTQGVQAPVGQIAMASVLNPDSLQSIGDNLFQASANTANPAIGPAGTGGRGRIMGGAIEYSTADIAREFANLIAFQRGYQANSRVITTVDQLTDETINLKR